MAIIEKIKISDEGIATLKKLKDEHKTFKDEVKSTRDELKKHGIINISQLLKQHQP